MKPTSSSVTSRKRPPAARAIPTDAQRALAWLQRGQPQHEIVYDDAVPKQTADELAQFTPASLNRA